MVNELVTRSGGGQWAGSQTDETSTAWAGLSRLFSSMRSSSLSVDPLSDSASLWLLSPPDIDWRGLDAPEFEMDSGCGIGSSLSIVN